MKKIGGKREGERERVRDLQGERWDYNFQVNPNFSKLPVDRIILILA